MRNKPKDHFLISLKEGNEMKTLFGIVLVVAWAIVIATHPFTVYFIGYLIATL